MSQAVNAIMGFLGDVLVGAVSKLPPVLGILVLALLVAALSLLVFKWTSNQQAIRAAKARLRSHLVGVVLFRSDPRLVLRFLFRAFLGSLSNLRFLPAPMAILFVPLFLLFVQLDFRFGPEGLRPGESTVLRVHLDPSASLDDISLKASEGVAVETPGVRVRDPGRNLLEVDFRIRAKKPGRHVLVVRCGEEAMEKDVFVGDGPGLKSPVRPGASFFEGILHPGEPALPGEGPIRSIELAYETASYPFLGLDWAWWTLFLLFMILGLFLLRRPLGVEF